MLSLKEIQEIINNAIISNKFLNKPAELYEPVNYSLSSGGKRLRPSFLIMACDMFNGNIQDAVSPALGIELFHNFTLLHDDIMDKSPIRRGRPTVYKKWNSNRAILSGDTMFALAYEYMLKINKDILPDVLEVFNKTAIQVCEGQQYDMNFENNINISLENYIEMIHLKTAVLLAASLKIGAIIAKADKKDSELIYDFGINTGIAFQLKDDLLDCFGNEKKFGKKIGNDIITNKKTFLYLKAFDLVDNKTSQELNNYFNDNNLSVDKKIKLIKNIYFELKVDVHTEKTMQKYYDKALKCLDAINIDNKRKAILKSLTDKLMDRED